MLAVLGEEPARLQEDHWWIESLAHARPTGPRALTRTLLLSGYRVGLTTPGSSPRLPGLRMGCRMQRPATDKPAVQLAGAAPVSADLLLTWDVPAVDLSYTSRDGTDNGERSKGDPLPAQS